MEEDLCFIYEDKFLPILERMLKQNWVDETERLIEEDEARKRKIILINRWYKLKTISKKFISKTKQKNSKIEGKLSGTNPAWKTK
jgi:hypothetical protein